MLVLKLRHSVVDCCCIEKDLTTGKPQIFISGKFRQKRPSGTWSGICFRQTPGVDRLLFSRPVVALLLIVYFHSHEYF